MPPENWIIGALLMFLGGFFVYDLQANFWPLSFVLLGEKYVGTGVVVMNTSPSLYAALGESLLGKIIDVTKSSSDVFRALAVICLLSSVTFLVSGFVRN